MNFLFCTAYLITEQSIMNIIDLVYYLLPLSVFRSKLERQYLECEFSCCQWLYEMKNREHLIWNQNIPLNISILWRTLVIFDQEVQFVILLHWFRSCVNIDKKGTTLYWNEFCILISRFQCQRGKLLGYLSPLPLFQSYYIVERESNHIINPLRPAHTAKEHTDIVKIVHCYESRVYSAG